MFYLSHDVKSPILTFLTFHQAQVEQTSQKGCNVKAALMTKIVHGHAGKFLFGLLELNKKPIVLMVGRVQLVFDKSMSHSMCGSYSLRSYYEGHSIQSITIPIRLMKRLGVETIVGKKVHDSVCSY